MRAEVLDKIARAAAKAAMYRREYLAMDAQNDQRRSAQALDMAMRLEAEVCILVSAETARIEEIQRGAP